VVVNFWGEVIFLPVSTVLDARIFNLSRSPPLWMNTTFNVDLGVTQADIDSVQNAMAVSLLL
jgi:small-conductance mechanosensitive channel